MYRQVKISIVEGGRRGENGVGSQRSGGISVGVGVDVGVGVGRRGVRVGVGVIGIRIVIFG